MTKLLSVIVPIYNVEEYLAQCIDSILNQTFTDFEIIVVNDGSTDSSPQICEEYAKKDSRVKVIHQKNAGVSVARNKGIENARGQYITFVDSDDWLELNMYEDMGKRMLLYEQPTVIMCDFTNIKKHRNERISSNIRNGFYTKTQIVNELFPTLLTTEEFGRIPIISIWNCWFQHSLFTDHKIRFDGDLKFSEDYLFMAEVMTKAASFYYLKGCYFYNYRQYEESRSKKFQRDWWENLLYLNKKLKDLLLHNQEYDFSRQIKLQLIHSALFTLSGIARTPTIGIWQKVAEVKAIFNQKELQAAFPLHFKKQRTGLRLVLYFMKNQLALPYLFLHWALKSIKNA